MLTFKALLSQYVRRELAVVLWVGAGGLSPIRTHYGDSGINAVVCSLMQGPIKLNIYWMDDRRGVS